MRKVYELAVIAIVLVVCVCGSVFAQAVQNVELHGYMLNRFYANPGSNAKFAMERVSLSAVGKLGEDGTGYIEVYYHPWLPDRVLGPSGNQFTVEQSRIYLESAYVDLPWANGRIRIGKGRHLAFGMTPTNPNRKTTQYGIVSETFTQDRVQGFQYLYNNKKGLDFAASLTTDLRIGNRKAGDFPDSDPSKVVPHFCERDDNANMSSRMAGSVKIGVVKPNLQAHVSGLTGRLVQADADLIGSAYGYDPGDNRDRDHNKYGADIMYTSGPYVAQGEWYQGNFSFLKISGYNILVGYQPKEGRRAYLRYSALHNDRARNENPLTWDIQQYTLGVIQPIRKGVWAELQYEKNKERGGNRKNDLLFVEFFTGF